MNKKISGVLAALAIFVAAVFIVNPLTLQRPMSKILEADPRNDGIVVSAHYGNYLNPSELTFDLKEVSGSNSPADVSRVLFQYAEALQDRKFDQVIISYRGTQKFYFEGLYFQNLGKEYGTQNPVYTMRTLPENVFTRDGSAAFGTWTGGLLGVVGKQMEDFNEFHKQWYLSEMSRGD